MLSRTERIDRSRNKPIKAAILLAIVSLSLLAPGFASGNPVATVASAASSASGPSGDVSSSKETYGGFLKSAEALYAAANGDQPEEVRSKLRELESRFRFLPMNGIDTAEGMQAIAGSIAGFKRDVAAAHPDEAKLKADAATIRLAADALAHPDKPLWHSYRSVIADEMAELNRSLKERVGALSPVPSGAVTALERLSSHYRTIRVSAMLKSAPEAVERADAVLTYTERVFRANPPNAGLLDGAVAALQVAMMALFPADEHSSAIAPPIAGPPWGWSAMMGTFIVTVLTWVGWRRYKADPLTGYPNEPKDAPPKDAAERILNRWGK